MENRPLDAVMIGAGQRGYFVFGGYALNTGDIRFVAVMDPAEDRRERFAAAHGLDRSRCFADLETLVASDVSADAWFVMSPDRYHVEPTRAAMAAGIPVFLEKPMAATPEDTVALVMMSEETGVLLHVAHGMRYTPLLQTLKGLIDSGAIGEIVSVAHRENIAAFHMAHSYVRGNWSNAADSAPIILAKSCHDLDFLTWTLQSRVERVSSFGSLFHFRPEAAPEGATDRCTDGCPVDDCPFDARAIYLNDNTGWPVHVISDDLSREGRLTALQEGPYGRCVYTAGSDVADNQVVAMELENGVSVSMSQHGHGYEEARTIRFDGTRGTIRAVLGDHVALELIDHRGGQPQEVPISAIGPHDPHGMGHHGGDEGAIASFIRAVLGHEESPSSARESLESHLLAFAAEESRALGTVVDMAEYRQRYGITTP